ncbi:unnamed protein product [Sympodiomycopsis kandeliae]
MAHNSSSASSSKKRHSSSSSRRPNGEPDIERKQKKSKHAGDGQAAFDWKARSGSSSDNSQRVEGILVDSPSFEPPKSMTLFHRKSHASSSSDDSSAYTNDSLVIGHRPSQAPNVVIESTNWDISDFASDAGKTARAKGYPGSYLLGVYDPETRKVSLHPAPLLSISRSIVPQAPDGSDAASTRIQSNYQTARRDLGELFGNRKQKLAMRNADRMKVDTTGMDESVLQGITDTVQGEVASSQSQSQQENGSQFSPADLASRPIPTPHLEATLPEYVYPLSELYPAEIASNINPGALMHAEDLDHIKKILPGPVYKSNWLQSRIWSRVLANRRSDGEGEGPTGILKSSPQKTQVKQLLYIAYLWSIRSLSSSSRSKILNDRKSLKEKLKLQRSNGEFDPNAESLLDQVLSIYCVKERSNNRLHLTSFNETKLLATICCLILHIDGFQIDPETIANEMSIQPIKIKEVLKSLGCSTRYRQVVPDLTSEDQHKPAVKGNKKVMVLKCPVKLPEGRNGQQAPKR